MISTALLQQPSDAVQSMDLPVEGQHVNVLMAIQSDSLLYQPVPASELQTVHKHDASPLQSSAKLNRNSMRQHTFGQYRSARNSGK